MNSENRSSVLRAVLDTNVIVSALIASRGIPVDVYVAAKRGAFRFVSSAPLLDEFERVFTVKFMMPPVDAARLRGRVGRVAEIIPVHSTVSVFPPGHGDNLVLATAADSMAGYLVTGDARHLLPLRAFRDCRIVTPREFLGLPGD